MVDRVRWILAQPSENDIKLGRLVHLVRLEKERSAEVAQSIHFHS